MKNLFLIIVTLPLLLGGCGGQKEKQTKKPPKLEHQANGNEITITKAHNLSEAFTIPSLIEGIPVTKIGNSAFEYSEITSITIPEGVTDIGERAFSNCDALTSITIPEGVTDIGERAFNSCKNLKKITIPDSVKTIGKGAFSWCGKLRSIKIPKGITRIEDETFSECINLNEITIPDNVTSLGYRAFDSCKNLKKITIPSSVASIGDFAFYMCGDLVLNFEGNCPKIDGDLGDLFFYTDPDFVKLFKNVEDGKHHGHKRTNPTILRQPNAAGWSDEWVGAPVKLISEKP